MSFLYLRGEMSHCEQCNQTLPIEFERVMETQIGDANVFAQKRMNGKYMPISYNPEEDDYYFHKPALCKDCLKLVSNNDIVYSNEEIPPFEMLLYRNDEVKNGIEETAYDQIDGFVTIIDKDYCSNLCQAVYDETIGSKKFKLACYKAELGQTYIKNARDYIIAAFKAYIKSTGQYTELIKEYEDSIIDTEKSCNTILLSGMKTYYQEVDMTQIVNFDPYIVHEETVGKRTAATANIQMYEGPYNISTAKIREHMKSDSSYLLNKAVTPVKSQLFEKVLQKITSFK